MNQIKRSSPNATRLHRTKRDNAPSSQRCRVANGSLDARSGRRERGFSPLLLCLLATLTSAIGCSGNSGEPTAEELPPEEPAIEIGVDELYQAYHEDRYAAGDKYDDLVVEVQGVVRRVGLNEVNAGTALLVDDPQDREPRVGCEICGTMVDGETYGSFADFERLAERQTVVIRGECKGFTGGGGDWVSLYDCKVLDIKPGPPRPTCELDGVWNAESIVYQGEPSPWLVEAIWDVRGDEIFVTEVSQTYFNEQFERRETMHCDAWLTLDTETDPLQITFEAPFTDRSIRAVYGIYRLDDARLTVCFAGSEESRPTELESPPESDVHLIEFQRAER